MPAKTVLFICTGNIFRSMAAEHAFRGQMGDAPVRAESAGIEASVQPMFAPVRERLVELGIDPSAHVQRKLTLQMLEDADLSVAMGEDHRVFVRERFGRDIPLFNRVARGVDEPVKDIGEVREEWGSEENWQGRYAIHVVDEIWQAIPAFVRNLAPFFRQ